MRLPRRSKPRSGAYWRSTPRRQRHDCVLHRLRSYLLPFSVVLMVDVDAAARLQQCVRNTQRRIPCGLWCDGRGADQITGLDDGCRYPDSWCGMANHHVADFRARTPRCTHRGPPGFVRCGSQCKSIAQPKSAYSANYPGADDAESRHGRPLVSTAQR
jgi:hypothetical protein